MRKTMKKAMAGAVAVGMLSAGTMTAYAAEPQTGSTTVQYTKSQESSFVLSIPQSVTLSDTEEVSKTVGVTAISVADSEKVQIKVTEGITNGAVTLTDKAISKEVSSKVSLTKNNTGEGIKSDDVVAEFEGTSTTATTGGTLYFAPVGEDAEVGTYEGTITFSASIAAKN
ncbi:MAG: hypothetical protein Q4D16_10615 [Eubacteriales bacterium]|nr:hypothetical protein [Eubacteriales bacterium]